MLLCPRDLKCEGMICGSCLQCEIHCKCEADE